MNKMRRLGVLIAIAALVVGVGGVTHALKAPHDFATVGGCNACHAKGVGGASFVSITSFETLCLNSQIGCHNVDDTAKKKALSTRRVSNRFKNIVRNSQYAAYSTTKTQSSHGWKIPNTNPNAGATVDWRAMPEYRGVVAPLNNKITCTRCHRAHGDFGPSGQPIYKSFLKADPKGDNICFQCHAARRIANVRSYNAEVASGTKHYSHPVEVNYSTVRAANPEYFETAPTLTAGYNESARPRLYTTIGGVKGAVVCSTCHGPLHAADSNPYTFDNLSAYNYGAYSSSAGNLLRQYPMSKAGHENKLCKSCHKVSYHKAFNKCSDCHEPHKKSGDKNLFLIKTSIMTPYGKRSVKFESTSTMASRWGIYSGSTPTDKSLRSTGVCQVCHRYTANHRAYSTTGAKRDHNYLGGASNRFKFCPECHKHVNSNSTGAFKAGGCFACHGDPPTIGKHSKHVGSSSGLVTWKWLDGTMNDARTDTSYGFSCGRCHTPWTPYTATQGSGFYEGKRHYGIDALNLYTADIGFKNKTPLPDSSGGSYIFGTTGAVDQPGSYKFRTPADGQGECRNLYCHGQFYGGYTSNNPNFSNIATQSCVGSCHGTNAAKLPGVNGTGEWGAHKRHIGNANSQQYGTSANFRCNACHYATSAQNNETTVTSRIYHVNGKTNVRFDPAYGDLASTYKGLNDYSGATNTAIIPASKTPYYTCGKIYCHSDGSRNQASQGSYSSAASYSTRAMAFPSWSSLKNFTTTTAGIKRCTKCHGNTTYRGITAAMPGYSRTNKGNKHNIHIITNRILCYACHSNTVGSDNRTISTAYHVNKTYDVNMPAAYGGTWDNSAKRCSNVKCHGQKLSPAWNEAARCQDCHFTSTGVPASNYTSEKRGYRDSYKFRNFTVQNSMPRIYSSEWKSKGHGSTLANKVCDDCHASTFRHLTANAGNNPYRLDNSDSVALCKSCHPTYKTHSRSDMQWSAANASWATFSTAGYGSGAKCVDCHDPHGDSSRSMIKKYINFTTGSDRYGRVAVPDPANPMKHVGQVTLTTVGGNQMNWSSYVKADYSGICQRCHNNQNEMQNFSKTKYSPDHFPKNRCTNCHLHTEGFKPKPCNGCHYFPPKDSGAGSDPRGVGGRMKHSRHVNWTSPYVTKGYANINNAPTATTYNFACMKCHAGGDHANDATDPRLADIGFDATAYPKNSGANPYVRFNGWTEEGAETGETPSYKFMYSSGKCSNLYCHGNFTGGKTTNVARFDNTSAAAGGNWSRVQRCGACHGAKATDVPSGGAHSKHVSTYALACKNCHRDVASTNANGFGTYSVTNKIYHVDGKTRLTFYTTEARIGGTVKYRNSAIQAQATTALSAYSFCQSLYCHSKGTNTLKPYTAVAGYPNYTAKWDNSNLPASPTEKCSYCHGSRKTAGGYAGITSAMPNYPSGSPKVNSHKKHVVDNGFNCSACHAKTVKGFGTISSINFHVNKVSDVYFPAAYSGVYNADKSCSRVKCHGKRRTPAWGGTVGCANCHFSAEGANDADIMDYSFRNYSKLSSVPKIYSGEWMASGHGKTGANYNQTNNPAAGKICNTCHVSSVKHNTGSNFFRLTGLGGSSDPSTLCKRCHGTSTERNTGWMGNRTGIQGHTQQILSSAGYTNLTTWRFQPKCTDCHDPHGDAQASSGNISMIRNTVLYNFSGSDSSGRPIRFPNLSTVNFVKFSGTTSFDDNIRKGRVCAVCHKRTAHNGNGSGHTNEGLDCRSCHKHKQGFNPSGCTGCHGDDTRSWSKPAPPKGPAGWSDSLTNMSSLHKPHAYNPKGRPGFGNQTGFACTACHGPQSDGRSEAGHPGLTNEAGMGNMTSSGTGTGKRSKINFGSGVKRPADDTCWNTGCHTPRAYTRTWKKPADCDDCHGYTKGKGAANRVFNLQTTQSHKIHINYTGIASPPASWKKNYNFACKNCHYDPANNYSTHYSGFVNITAGGTVNTKGGQFYTRTRSFKGFSTGNELVTVGATCSNTYCHGNFTNGGPNGDGVAGQPNWKKGVTTLNCNSCHRGKEDGADGSLMPERHPKHAATNQYNFACARCHVRTVANNTTVQFNWSSHVNARKDTYFNTATTVDLGGKKFTMNNTNATFGGGNRACKNTYCHSKGTDRTAPFNTRTSFSNFTAQWGENIAILGYKKPAGQKAKCNYCHGNRAYSGTTSAMPNYSGNLGFVKAKANSHRVHVLSNGIVCSICHNSIAMNNTSISDRSRHANGFYNISIAPIKRLSGGLKVYSMVYDGTGGTCMNNTCHGTSTPKWGAPSTASCKACHLSATNKDVDSYGKKNDGKTAMLYSSEWGQKGHGAWNRTCDNCHSSNVAHGDETRNPFRLYTSAPDALCLNCHGTGTQVGNWGQMNYTGSKQGYKTHSKANAQAGTAAKWNNFSTRDGRGTVKCVDCHDPHGDKNKKMIQSFINFTGSDRFGRPTRADFTTVSSIYSAQMTFTSLGGNINWSSFANTNVNNSICRRCHTPIGQDSGMGDAPAANPGNMTKTNYAGGSSHQASHQACTGCHKHAEGFKGGGEPAGADNCIDCHSTLFNSMKSSNGSSYHHVMINSSGVFASKTAFGSADLFSKQRRCLMCHVRHKEFSPEVTAGRSRAKNLRRSALATHDNQTGINTDFWPAKRSAPRSDGTANYSSSKPITGPSGSNGVCISCHKSVQTKNTTFGNDAIKSSKANNFAVNLYTSSSHNFQIISGMNNFGDGSSFRANCTKCHRTWPMDRTAQDGGRVQFALHDRNEPSLLNSVTSSSKPQIEQLCYKCHSVDSRSGDGPGDKYDYYSSIKMSSGAKMIQTAIEAKKSGHPVDSEAMAGRHKADEFFKLPNSYRVGRSGAEGGAGSGWNRGTNRHVECVDCHNTHGGNASITRAVGTANGNKAAGSQSGTWGIKVKYAGSAPANYAQPTYSTISRVTYQYELCLKCHSAFSYNTTLPAVPSGGPGRFFGDTFVNLWDAAAPQTDVGMDFHPANHGYHPVVAKGRNQPPHSANTNWAGDATNRGGTRRYIDSKGATVFQGVSGLGWSFVPPFSQKSLLACSDCHQADNSGTAVQRVKPAGTPTWGGTWTGNTFNNIKNWEDGYYATSTATSSTLTTDVSLYGGSQSVTRQELWVVAYGSTTDTSRNGVKQSLDYSNGTWAGLTANCIFGANSARCEAQVTNETSGANLESVYQVKFTSNVGTVTLDYVGLESVYVETRDVRGPHGSLQKWILQDVDMHIRFDADLSGTISGEVDVPNSISATYPLDTNSTADRNEYKKHFCFNCHRRDVYDGGKTTTWSAPDPTRTPYGRYSRWNHPGEDVAGVASANVFGIYCLNCHSGRSYVATGVGAKNWQRKKLNGVHGSFANRSTYNNTNGAYIVTLNRPKGVRLLMGANIEGVQMPTSGTAGVTVTCYTTGDDDSMGSCVSHDTGNGTAVTLNYDYTSW